MRFERRIHIAKAKGMKKQSQVPYIVSFRERLLWGSRLHSGGRCSPLNAHPLILSCSG